ncbi:MAG: hypothetical protein NTV46_09480 [Verrucomicrobia bacterium]|nr:hypothetical protein [Verrucomicrobiota bacterium]
MPPTPHFLLPGLTDPAIVHPLEKEFRRLDLSPPTTRQIDRKDRESPDSPANVPP